MPSSASRVPARGQQGLVALTTGGVLWALLWLAARVLDVQAADRGQRGALLAGVALGGGLLALACGLLAARRPAGLRHLPPVLVGLSAGAVAGLGTLALHGTRWSFGATYSDSGFRTEAATRFADSPALADYAYRGLLSYYPPALPWVEGRVADLLGVPGWAAMKPVVLVLALLVPVAAYAGWRRLLPDPVAAVVVVATTAATADLVKPDEWLVLAVVLPWWLDLVRGLRRPDACPLPAWVHGIVLGALLDVHSYYAVPLAIATVGGVVLDLLARRPPPLRPLRAVVVVAVGLVVAAPYWVPLAVEHLRGGTADDLQRRWSPPGFESPPLPLPPHVVGLLGAVGVLWLVGRLLLRAPHRPGTVPGRVPAGVAGALGLLLVTMYAFFVLGQVAQRWGVAVLPEKSADLVEALLVTSGVLALADARWLLVRRRGARPAAVLVTVLAVALAVPAALGYARHWVVGRPVLAAQQIRYPDGTYPGGGLPTLPTTRHPWSVDPLPTGPSTDQVAAAWQQLAGAPLSDRTVLVTSRVDLLATTPVHPFVVWKSIYSHPYGRFDARLALLRRAAACTEPGCAWRLLHDNDFDRVDGLVLTERSGRLGLTVTTDAFPEGWRPERVSFDVRVLRSPWFRVAHVRGVAVVRLAPRPPQ